MTQTYESGYVSTLAKKLSSTDTSIEVATAPTVTSGRLYITDGAQEAWCNFTGVSSTTLTGVTFVSDTLDPATSTTGKTFIAGTKVALVAMHDQLLDKQQDNVLPKAIAFSGTTNSGIRVNNLTTAQKNALSSPANGMIVYDTTLGEYSTYNAGSWYSLSAGSTQPNASATVAGKVEIATTAQSKAGTDTGETSALLSVLPSDIAANTQSSTFVYAADGEASDTYVIALTPAITAYTTGMKVRFKANTINTGACTINVNALGAKNIKLKDGTDPLNGDIAASEITELVYDGTNFVLQSIPRRAINGSVTSIPAGEAVDGSTTPQAVYISDGTGGRTSWAFYKSDANDTTNAAHTLSGFVNVNASGVGTSYGVIMDGVVGGFSGLSAGAMYYLSDTPGAISTTPGTVVVPVGYAVSATQIAIYKGPVTYSGAATYLITGSGNNDLTVYTPRKARLIRIELKFGAAGAAGGDYRASTGTKTYLYTTHVSSNALHPANTASATALTTSNSGIISTTETFDTTGAGASYDAIVLSIPTNTKFSTVIRVANTRTGSPATNSSASISYTIITE